MGKLLQTGLIQGKNPRALAKDLRKYMVGGEGSTGAAGNIERLMRTELARVQTEAQKQSFIRNGFSMYEYICNFNGGAACPVCQGLNGKHFKVADMMPGENAPPMHPNCRCSTAAWEDDAEYEAWLDFLDKGGTTAEWEKLKKPVANAAGSGKMKVGIQFFANKSITKQSDKQLLKSIASWNAKVEEHENKIQSPEVYDRDWDTKTDVQKTGLLRHWEKEIKNFKTNIKDAEAELEKRRDTK